MADVHEITGAALEPVPFSVLNGWAADDHAAAFSAFQRTCSVVVAGKESLRQGAPVPPALAHICHLALEVGQVTDGARARHFFETHFHPHRVRTHHSSGFLTGYFEPEFFGSLTPSAVYDTPLLSRPDDLVTVAEGETLPGVDPSLRGARRITTAHGELFEPYSDRAAIEDGALVGRVQPLVYLERVDAFMAHVQGSVRVRLVEGAEQGRVLRFAYAGRNGHAYTSVARLVVTETGLTPAALTAPRLVDWLRANPDAGRRLMRRNRSYIFFREADELVPHQGPVGGASVQLTPGRSLAIDRWIWPYGMPIWLEATLPLPESGQRGEAIDRTETWRRLMIAQDTGSAIIGPARADIFFGSGAAAGARAGIVRHPPADFVVLLPLRQERGL